MNEKTQERSHLMFLGVFIFHNLLSVLLVQTFYVPDEYWQSVEVSHHLVYGYGYLTWEWKECIRSCTYPIVIALFYKILSLVNCDHLMLLIILPRLLQAVLTGIGNYYIYKLSTEQFGYRVGKWTAFCLLSSWFLFYCASRTLTNTAEAAVVSCGLYYFPWIKSSSLKWKYLWLAGLSCMIRPTAVLLWLPLYVWHCVRERRQIVYLILKTLQICIICVLTMVLIDRMCLGKWTFTPYRFFHFNWLHDIGAFYGSNPWHWYFTQGFPAVMGFHLLPFLLASPFQCVSKFLKLIVWLLVILSVFSHKEFRFLLPILPLSLCLSGFGLQALAQSGKKHSYLQISYRALAMVIIIVLGNLSLCVYTSFYHQRGTLDVMNYISKVASKSQNTKVLFLMPCHSTPFYSHVHKNISMQFLTCEPNIHNQPEYLDEADVFYESPTFWLADKFGSGIDIENSKTLLPSHLVMYDILFSYVSEFLLYHNYEQCFKTYHTSFPHGRISKYVEVYCRQQSVQ